MRKLTGLDKIKIFVGIVIFCTIPIFALARGFVIEIMWRLLILPIFPTLPKITIVHAMGLSLFITFFTFYARSKDKEKQTQEAWGFLSHEIWRLIFAYIGAYIINYFY